MFKEFLIMIAVAGMIFPTSAQWIVNGNEVSKVNETEIQYKVVLLSPVTAELVADSINLYIGTYGNFYSVNKSTGEINYKIPINGSVKKIYIDNSSVNFYTGDNTFYIVNASSGDITSKFYYPQIDDIYNDFSLSGNASITYITQNGTNQSNIFDNLYINKLYKNDTVSNYFVDTNVMFRSEGDATIGFKSTNMQVSTYVQNSGTFSGRSADYCQLSGSYYTCILGNTFFEISTNQFRVNSNSVDTVINNSGLYNNYVRTENISVSNLSAGYPLYANDTGYLYTNMSAFKGVTPTSSFDEILVNQIGKNDTSIDNIIRINHSVNGFEFLATEFDMFFGDFLDTDLYMTECTFEVILKGNPSMLHNCTDTLFLNNVDMKNNLSVSNNITTTNLNVSGEVNMMYGTYNHSTTEANGENYTADMNMFLTVETLYDQTMNGTNLGLFQSCDLIMYVDGVEISHSSSALRSSALVNDLRSIGYITGYAFVPKGTLYKYTISGINYNRCGYDTRIHKIKIG